MAKDDDAIIDPDLMTSITKVKTEFYLGQQADRCMKLGIYKHIDPIPYRNAIKQLEILSIGSDRLDAKFRKEKKELIKEKNERLKEVSEGFNAQIKKSKLNQNIQQQRKQIEEQYDEDLHFLLMKYLAPIFWEKEVIEII